MTELLEGLGYEVQGAGVHAPSGRQVFVGDLVDRGPGVPGVMARVMEAVADGVALWVQGHHNRRLAQAMAGRLPAPTFSCGSHRLWLNTPSRRCGARSRPCPHGLSQAASGVWSTRAIFPGRPPTCGQNTNTRAGEMRTACASGPAAWECPPDSPHPCGRLTALHFPQREVCSAPAARADAQGSADRAQRKTLASRPG
ncbi:hypothetical protein [Deinococcus hopiensis]|uniref:hypothetical protein n=1 Tax=Deinococcus hopiensis TaxID=309885 RepID=UPI00111C6348|nr:hypothetical protein [Deinococcus hopiensis]